MSYLDETHEDAMKDIESIQATVDEILDTAKHLSRLATSLALDASETDTLPLRRTLYELESLLTILEGDL